MCGSEHTKRAARRIVLPGRWRPAIGTRNRGAQPLAKQPKPKARGGGVTAVAVANSLLASLPHAEYQRLLAGSEPLTLKLKMGEALHEPGVPIRYVYFPVDCVISLLTTVEGHRAVEVGLVGREGMVGISAVLGVDVSSVRALVQATGKAMRMDAALFNKVFQQCPSLQREVFRYTNAKLAWARQTIACSCFHAAEARLARWLLTLGDRVLSQELLFTQALLADALGLRRSTVTVAAGLFQQRNLISCRRGRIRILDRKGLEAASCGCYSRIDGTQTAAAA